MTHETIESGSRTEPSTSTESVEQLRSFWNLDPDTVYLNHGSFGPSPLPVQKARNEWTERLERQPMRFFCQEMEEHLEITAAKLAGFLHTKPERLALIDNATVAMNVVADSVVLGAGDEVLLTDHEYGAVRNIWSRKCQSTGARLQSVEIPLSLGSTRDKTTTEDSESEIVDAIERRITPRTRLIVVSHVTSATSCILPVKAICRMAQRHGVLVCIDGPHAVAMLDIFMEDIGCDFYCASCHKWLCAPFGSGFLWVHPRHHGKVRCPVVSWGGSIAGRAASWQDRINWLGTRDPAALLAIGAAIDFFTPERLQTFRSHAHRLVTMARSELLKHPHTGPFFNPAPDTYVSMCGMELPQPDGWKPGYHGHPDPLQLSLRKDFGIEIPVASWNGHRYLRISAHLYTTEADIRRLLEAISL
ncbi:MAG: aminotransferase class V-fold PLP-dependent enzyme [Planctomycetaceae bacterium]